MPFAFIGTYRPLRTHRRLAACGGGTAIRPRRCFTLDRRTWDRPSSACAGRTCTRNVGTRSRSVRSSATIRGRNSSSPPSGGPVLTNFLPTAALNGQCRGGSLRWRPARRTAARMLVPVPIARETLTRRFRSNPSALVTAVAGIFSGATLNENRTKCPIVSATISSRSSTRPNSCATESSRRTITKAFVRPVRLEVFRERRLGYRAFRHVLRGRICRQAFPQVGRDVRLNSNAISHACLRACCLVSRAAETPTCPESGRSKAIPQRGRPVLSRSGGTSSGLRLRDAPGSPERRRTALTTERTAVPSENDRSNGPQCIETRVATRG